MGLILETKRPDRPPGRGAPLAFESEANEVTYQKHLLCAAGFGDMATGGRAGESLPAFGTKLPARNRVPGTQWGSIICGMNCRKV